MVLSALCEDSVAGLELRNTGWVEDESGGGIEELESPSGVAASTVREFTEHKLHRTKYYYFIQLCRVFIFANWKTTTNMKNMRSILRSFR